MHNRYANCGQDTARKAENGVNVYVGCKPIYTKRLKHVKKLYGAF